MSLPPAFLDELRFRVPLAQVVGRKVKLTRAGREWKGCCPFHTEKTPSFYINEDKQFYHCFGCGAHGDVIRFLTDGEGMPFMEAVKQLAAEAGMEVPEETPEERAKAERAASLYEVMDRAAAWFEEQLQGMSGAGARDYVRKRGLTADIIKRFRLGYAPDSRTSLKAALSASGIMVDQLVEAGLLISVEDKDPYDRFRGRLMFPIRDPKGRVIAFGGRVLDGGEPKYLNSPDTPLFDKGRTLYNFDQAGPVARKSGTAHIVEGYMDVIALAQAGLETAVAPLGTALTETQMQLLWRVSPEPLVCLDGDTAGQRAALRAANRALSVLVPGRSLRFLTLPPGDDPDSLVKSKGLNAFNGLATNAETLIDLLWRSEVSGQDHSTPERRAALRQRLMQVAGEVTDSSVAALYKSELLTRFDKLTGRSRTGAYQPGKGGPQPVQRGTLARKDGFEDRIAAQLLLAACHHPGILEHQLDLLSHLPVSDAQLAGLRDALCDIAAQSAENLDKTRLATTLGASGWQSILEDLETQHRWGVRFVRSGASAMEAESAFKLLGTRLVQLITLKQELSEVSAQAMDDEASFERQQVLNREVAQLNEQLQNYETAQGALPERS
jgi:DNA primase